MEYDVAAETVAFLLFKIGDCDDQIAAVKQVTVCLASGALVVADMAAVDEMNVLIFGPRSIWPSLLIVATHARLLLRNSFISSVRSAMMPSFRLHAHGMRTCFQITARNPTTHVRPT